MRISAIILAGGQGQRVGGADKGLLPWQDRPRVNHVIERLSPQVDELVISANRNLEAYASLATKVIRDELADFQGPLAGLDAAIAHCQYELVLVVPCDCPTLPLDLAPRLASPLLADEADLSYVFDGQYKQPLFSVLRRELQGELKHYLEQGGRSVRGWHESLRTQPVDFSDQAEAFINLNDR